MIFLLSRRRIARGDPNKENPLMMMLPRPFILLLLICLSLAAAVRRAAAQGPGPQPTPDVYVQAYSGEQEPGAPTGADFLRFFTPEVGFFLSAVSPGHPTASGSNLLDIGGMYDDFPNAVLTGFTAPTGDGLLATFKPGVGGVTASDNVAMLYGELDYPPNINTIAETGVAEEDLPEGVTIKKFLTLDAEGVPFFFAILQGTGVTPANSLALCTFNYNIDEQIVRGQSVPAPGSLSYFGSPLIILARVGDTVVTTSSQTKIIKSITTLTGSKGTLADGRWRSIFEGDGYNILGIGVLITFTDGTEAIYTIPDYAQENPSDWFFFLQSGLVTDIAGLDGSTINSFGLPSFDNSSYAVLANLKLGGIAALSTTARVHRAPGAVKPLGTVVESPTVTATNNVALLYGGIYGRAASVLARKMT